MLSVFLVGPGVGAPGFRDSYSIIPETTHYFGNNALLYIGLVVCSSASQVQNVEIIMNYNATSMSLLSNVLVYLCEAYKLWAPLRRHEQHDAVCETINKICIGQGIYDATMTWQVISFVSASLVSLVECGSDDRPRLATVLKDLRTTYQDKPSLYYDESNTPLGHAGADFLTCFANFAEMLKDSEGGDDLVKMIRNCCTVANDCLSFRARM